MRSVLAIAAGVDGPDSLPAVHDNTAKVTVGWDPEEVADHTGVTATFGARWPGSQPGARRAGRPLLARGVRRHRLGGHRDGFPVVEGLLSLVHLDHAAHICSADAQDRGRIDRHRNGFVTGHRVRTRRPGFGDDRRFDGTELARLEERFAIRGRTGAAELADPPRAGGAITDNATDTPRRRRRDVTSPRRPT